MCLLQWWKVWWDNESPWRNQVKQPSLVLWCIVFFIFLDWTENNFIVVFYPMQVEHTCSWGKCRPAGALCLRNVQDCLSDRCETPVFIYKCCSLYLPKHFSNRPIILVLKNDSLHAILHSAGLRNVSQPQPVQWPQVSVCHLRGQVHWQQSRDLLHSGEMGCLD